jgi:5,10-methylenetetrahydrofolate reductase
MCTSERKIPTHMFVFAQPTLSQETMVKFQNDLDRLFETVPIFILILDGTAVEYASVWTIASQAKYMQANRDRMKQHVPWVEIRCSKLGKLLLDCLFWLSPPAVEVKITVA